MVTIYKGKGVHGTPREDINFGSPTSSLMVPERKSSIQLNISRATGVESASYNVPDDLITDIFSSFHMCFGLIPER